MLKRCVQSAIDSAEQRPISVFIADDSMSDVNLEVLQELCAQFPCIHWHRNKTNLGIDLNIQCVVAMSDCDYNWLIGEDDLFLPGAVAHMFDVIQKQSHPFIFSNYQYVSENHRQVIGIALTSLTDGECAANKFIEEALWSVGFIGSCVLQRKTWETTTGIEYNGTYFTHVGRILDMLAGQHAVYISEQPAIANRAQGEDTFTWKKDSFGVFLGFERMCRIAAERNPSLRVAIQLAANNYRLKFAYLSVKTTFRLRSEGAFDLHQFRAYIPQLEIERWRKVWLLGLAITPIILIKPLAFAYIFYQRRVQRIAVARAQ